VVRTPLYCPRLVGRDGELAALAELARRAAAGESVFAFIAGEAGAGKTRLIDELRRHLPRGMRGVRGTCMEYAPSPMGSVLDVIAALEAEHGSPDAGADLAAPTGDDPVDKRRLFERVTAALHAAGSGRPFAMILDDAHWADTVTLELLQFLIGTLRDARVLIVVAYRTEELAATHPLHALVARAMRARHVQLVELEPLSGGHVHELIDATLPPNVRLSTEALRDVRERSEGNPLFAEEFLKSAVDGVRSGDARTLLPASLRGLLLERLARLGHEEMRLLEIAALIGRRFAAAFLARLGGRNADSLAPFLRLVVDEHFLVEDATEPGWFSFRHALTRDTILSGILAVQMRALHVRIAQEIEREPDRDARIVELADHYWRAACFTECAGYAEQAGDLAKLRHAYAEAAEQYERALACGVADERGLVVLHEKAAAAYASLGGPQKVIEHFDVAVAHYTAAGQTERLVEIYLDLALAYRRTAQTERAFDVLRRAWDLSKKSGNAGLVFSSASYLAHLHALDEEWSDAETYLREAEPLLAVAEPRPAVRYHVSRAMLHLARHELDGWHDGSETAIAIARAHGDPTLIAFALTTYGVNARKVGQFEVALAAFREAAETGRTYGVLYIAAFAKLVSINVLYLFGELSAARDEMLEVLAELHESVTIRILTAQFGVALAIALRDETLFQRCYAPDVLEAAFATNEPLHVGPLAATIAEYHLAAGDEPAAVALLQRMLAALPQDWEDCEALLPVAVCCSQAVVERVRARFGEPGTQLDDPYTAACRELFDAYAAARFGSRDAKLRHAKSAAALLQRLRVPLMEAEAYELAEQPARSVALCERIGALRPPRRLGPQLQRRSSATQLTPREREVVDYALSGFSNSAIADELSLSERTVEAHVAAAYRKLGVRSRGELISVLARGT
jgi:DNA-binding CsgD family transcriptional regulator